MPLQANDTHVHFTKKTAIAAAEKAGLDPDDLHFYAADPGNGRKSFGWCAQDLAEISAAADHTPDPDPVELLEEAAPVVADGIIIDTSEDDEDLTVAAIMARNAERQTAAPDAPAYEEPEIIEGLCNECGEAAFIGEDGVSHHGGEVGIDYKSDADHVAVVPEPSEEPTPVPPVLTPEPDPYPVANVIVAPQPTAPEPGERMVVIQIAGPMNAELSEILAISAAARTGSIITPLDAATFVAGEPVHPPANDIVFVDGKGGKHSPTMVQSIFIALCSREGGVTSDGLRAAIDSGLKKAPNWSAMGDEAERFGFTYEVDSLRISRKKIEIIHFLRRIGDTKAA